MLSSTGNVLPLLVIFGLDETLWPHNIDLDFTAPVRKLEFNRIFLYAFSNGSLIDSEYKVITRFADVPAIFQKLHDSKIKIGVTSLLPDPENPSLTIKVLELFDLLKYISFMDLEKAYKRHQFLSIRMKSRIRYNDMLFFDDLQEDIDIGERKGIISVLVKGGITMEKFENGIKLFQDRKANITTP